MKKIISLFLSFVILTAFAVIAVRADTTAVQTNSPITTETEANSSTEEEAAGVVVNDYNIVIDDSMYDFSTLKSRNIMLYNADTTQTLFARKADELLYPGPTVKLMTGIVAIELFKDRLDEKIPITYSLAEGYQGNHMGIVAGETLTIRQLLYGLLIGGKNDCAMVLSRLYTGSSTDFIEKMNEKAAELKMKNTFYKNVTGLDVDGMTTTIPDMLRLTQYIMKNSYFVEIASAPQYTIEKTEKVERRILINRNSFAASKKYDIGDVYGFNYGSSENAGECLVLASKYNGTNYILIIMKGYEDTEGVTTVFSDAKLLYDYANSSFGLVKILDKSKIICEIPVELGTKKDNVTIVPRSDISIYLPLALDYEKSVDYDIKLYSNKLDAPVEEGQCVGELILKYENQELCRVELVTKGAVVRNNILYLLSRVEALTHKTAFVVGVIFFVIVFVIYVFVNSMLVKAKNNRKRRL